MRCFCLTLAILLAGNLQAQRESDPIRMTHGPMLGRPTATSMAVWARTSQPGDFWVHYGIDPNDMDLISNPGKTTIDHDNTGVATLKDLRPDSRYHYQVYVNERPHGCLLYTSPSPRDQRGSRMPSSA